MYSLFYNVSVNRAVYLVLFLGFCTEFNIAGGVIQVHALAKCNNKFPRCGKPYYSTDAYKCKSVRNV